MYHVAQALHLAGDEEQSRSMFSKASESLEVEGKLGLESAGYDEFAFEHLIDMQHRL